MRPDADALDDVTHRVGPSAGLLDGTNGRDGLDGHAPALKPIGAAVTAAGLARRAGEAQALAESLRGRDVAVVAITIVDNAGIARVKTIPVTGLEHATRWGVGLSPVYGVATVDESFTACASVGDPAAGHASGRLPSSLDQALDALARSEVIPAAMGPMLYDAFTAVRAAEAETFSVRDPDTIAAAHRWVY